MSVSLSVRLGGENTTHHNTGIRVHKCRWQDTCCREHHGKHGHPERGTSVPNLGRDDGQTEGDRTKTA